MKRVNVTIRKTDYIDFLVIGSGVVGLSLANELQKLHHNCRVVLIEKEKYLAAHASGRNSGVLHSGFYYTADTHKARFTRDGNTLMRHYCREKGLKINQCGKLVVVQEQSQLDGLKELQRRGEINGVELQWLTEEQAKKIEPNIKTYEAALWSPTTASVDPQEVVNALAKDARHLGVDIKLNTAYIKVNKDNLVTTTQGKLQVDYVINCAGLFADRIAQDFGFAQSYRILPFKGLYLYAGPNSTPLRTNIYPVPNFNYPFLGVHFTVTIDGRTKLGPTAIPAFWREHYRWFENFNLSDFLEIAALESQLFFGNYFGFRDLAFEEMRKYQKSYMLREAQKLLHNVELMGFNQWGKPGIRAQLVNIKEKKLEMDFKYEGDNKSFHVLNAVSPAFTCALSFAKHLVNEIDKLAS